MKKLLAILLSALLALGAVCCAAEEAAKFTAGTYTSVQPAHNGEMTVQVSFSNDAITEVKVTEHAESERIGDAAIQAVASIVVDKQTLDVDVVSGSTVTYGAMLRGVLDCLKQAGGSEDDLLPYSAPVMEDEEAHTQLVVVGGGGAGLSAAVEAAQQGVEVLLVEKLATLGGSTGHSSGIVLTTSEDDSFTAQDFYDLHVTRAGTKPPLAQRIADVASGTVDWLVDQGMVFYDVHPTVDKWTVTYMSPDANGGVIRPNGMKIINVLEKTALESGKVDIRLNTRATELLVEDGAVKGIVAVRPDGSKLTVRADAVILACGGYDNGEKMKELEPNAYAAAHVSGSGNTGDGIAMAEAVGAATSYTAPIKGAGNAMGMNKYGLPANFLCVNGNGERIVAEDAHYSVETQAIMNSASPYVYRIYDSNNDVTVLEANVAKGIVTKADTLEELAAKLNIDYEAFAATVARYNELKGQEDADMGKAAELMLGIEKAPFYGIRVVVEILLSMGGVVADEEGRIINTEGAAIPCLYGAGEFVNADYFVNAYAYSGAAVQHALATGRIAAQNAIANDIR